MREFNQSVDLLERQRWKILLEFFHAFAKLIAADDRIGKNAGPRLTTGRPDTLPGTCSISSQAVQSICRSNPALVNAIAVYLYLMIVCGPAIF
jgi:hypothetical protein